MANYDLTPFLQLKKVKPGQRDWAIEERTNWDIVDQFAKSMDAFKTFKHLILSLTPTSAYLSGKTEEPVLYLMEGTNRSWHELRYDNTNLNEATFFISGGELEDYDSFKSLQLRLRWKSSAIEGNVLWGVSFTSIADNIDIAPQPYRILTPQTVSTTPDNISESTMEFFATNNEVQTGHPCFIKIARLSPDVEDTVETGTVALIDATVRMNFGENTGVNWTNNFNTLISNGFAESSGGVYTYDDLGRVSTSTETFTTLGLIRTANYYYNEDGTLDTIESRFDGILRRETFHYVDGCLVSATVTETPDETTP